jgi:hypothetical protein
MLSDLSASGGGKDASGTGGPYLRGLVKCFSFPTHLLPSFHFLYLGSVAAMPLRIELPHRIFPLHNGVDLGLTKIHRILPLSEPIYSPPAELLSLSFCGFSACLGTWVFGPSCFAGPIDSMRRCFSYLI